MSAGRWDRAELLDTGEREPTGEWADMARSGCLLGYGPNFDELERRVAGYVARILNGAAPGELPIEEPTRFGFAINLKTAKTLDLTLPQSILGRADEVIE